MLASPTVNSLNPTNPTLLNPNCQNTTKLYIRRANKSTVIAYTSNNMTGHQLRQLASIKTNICVENIVLFLRGQKIQNIQQNNEKIYLVNNCDILHVHDISSHPNILMDIILKPFQCVAFDSEQQIHFSTKSQYKIRDSLKDHIKITQDLSFVESGRKLNIDRSYQEELVENNSTIYITTFKPVVAVIQRQKQNQQVIKNKQIQNKLFISQQNSIFNKNVAQMQQIKRVRAVLPPLKPSPLKKSMSWGQTNSGNLMSFKKKQKPSIYKSMKIMDGKEEVWVSDSSGDLKNNLKKQMPLKKHRDHYEIKEEVSVDQKHSDGSQDIVLFSDQEKQQIKNDQKVQNVQLTSEERKQLRKQLNKLLFSDLFDFKPSVSVAPPQMKTDDFLQQTEQIQMKGDGYEQDNEYVDSDDAEDEQEDEQQNKKVTDKLNGSNDLRQSIGKSRGSFIVPMIPTRDFERDSSSGEEDSDQ